MAHRNRPQTAGHVLDERADVVPRLVRDKAAVLDARQVQQVAHHAVEPQRLVLDRADEFVALAVGPGDVPLPQAAG